MTLLLLAGGFVFATAIVVLILFVIAQAIDLWGKPLIERSVEPVSLDNMLDACDWRWPA